MDRVAGSRGDEEAKRAVAEPEEPDLPTPGDTPFMQLLGLTEWSVESGCAELVLTLRPEHMNTWHVGHGGVTMSLLDVVMSLAGRSLDPKARAGATVEMKTSFLAPAGKPGERLLAKGRAFHRSTTLFFCEGELWNGDRLVAKALGTYKVRRRLPKLESKG